MHWPLAAWLARWIVQRAQHTPQAARIHPYFPSFCFESSSKYFWITWR